MPETPKWERRADSVVHVLGLAFAVAACISMAVVCFPRGNGIEVASVAIYGVGLLGMLGCSALYHLAWQHRWREAFVRLDRAAIFVMISATYTPFTLVAMGGRTGIVLCAFVWAVALVGASLQLAAPARLRRIGVAMYVLLGWSAVFALGPLVRALSVPGLVLLGTGGGLYTLGIPVYLSKLPGRRAIWHAFVLAAAACHFSAVLTVI
jgi:hemolysin III